MIERYSGAGKTAVTAAQFNLILTAQAAAKTSCWLPDGMAVGDEAAKQAKPNSVEVDAVSPDDDADALPPFMSDAA